MPNKCKDLNLCLAGMSEDESWALAQFVKRVGWNDYRKNASSDREAEYMSEAFYKLQISLANAGYNPR